MERNFTTQRKMTDSSPLFSTIIIIYLSYAWPVKKVYTPIIEVSTFSDSFFYKSFHKHSSRRRTSILEGKSDLYFWAASNVSLSGVSYYRSNKALIALLNDPNIVTTLKSQILRWAGIRIERIRVIYIDNNEVET